MTPDPRPGDRVAPHGLRAVLDALCDGDPDAQLPLRELVGDLGQSAFGVLLLVAALLAFLPPGVAGAVSGPLVILVGLQLLVLQNKPWLPGFVARRGPLRSTLIRLDRAGDRWLRWLERLVRPRLTIAIDHPIATVVTGLLLVLLGILLALPIPFTNYIFAGLLLLYALALLERDGLLMLLSWIAGAIAIYALGAASIGIATKLWMLVVGGAG
jgi:hypothetical protein